MRLRSSASARAWLGVLACAGVLATHWLAYRVAVPDAEHRGVVLAATGHGYLDYAVAIGVGALVAGLAGFAWRGADAPGGPDSRPSLYRFAAVRLASLQAAAFLGLEVAERMVVGEHLGDFFHEPVLMVGMVVQALVAAVGALLLVAVARVVHHLRRSPVPLPVARAQGLIPRAPRTRSLHRPLLAAGGTGLRGPPF